MNQFILIKPSNFDAFVTTNYTFYNRFQIFLFSLLFIFFAYVTFNENQNVAAFMYFAILFKSDVSKLAWKPDIEGHIIDLKKVSKLGGFVGRNRFCKRCNRKCPKYSGFYAIKWTYR